MTHPIDLAGGPAKVAKICGVSAPSCVQWRRDGVPIKRAVQIEQGTGRQVMRWDLRPLDWHEIWPELIGLPGAPALPQPLHRADAAPVAPQAASAAKEAACHE
ncbi:helix-turn-helix domain-containing protein [Piscinibacter sp. Jin2]|uniref:Helix-turn-helix domain-containing protein n=1 Tax=Aquariibacter lacus TaxID=2801332 RepID=A0A9X0XE51_9BURK|nr:YdaS family helix-turn-helix protein [Piscinibacter lacus]MBL0720209.1 helix-turn-helix domain-containing protein [Piscinibacter lacus]